MRGNCRTSGEQRRREAGNVFGLGSRTPISITLLVKNPAVRRTKASIYYKDIGDYLGKDDKLKKLRELGSILNPAMELSSISPNEAYDWINQRDSMFETLIAIEPDKKYDVDSKSMFVTHSRGLETSRDPLAYNSSPDVLAQNAQNMISQYNQQRLEYREAVNQNPLLKVEEFVHDDSSKIIWTRGTKNNLLRNVEYSYAQSNIRAALYRPFFKQHVYLSRQFNEYVNQWDNFFPTPQSKNLVICVSGIGVRKECPALIVNMIADLELIGKSQCFPLYYYDKIEQNQISLFDQSEEEYIRRDGISDFILERVRKCNPKITKEDIFFYIYGILHSKSYRKRFSADLKKMLPHIPIVEMYIDFNAFCKAGRQLAELHLNYEQGKLYDGVMVTGEETGNFKVEKMRFISKEDKRTIIYNSNIRIENIPLAAYTYVVNGKSAIEWIMERYQVTRHPDSQIINDPNRWTPENPKYILELLLRVIQMSLDTMKIVAKLPELKFES